jgi:hypothetical protein
MEITFPQNHSFQKWLSDADRRKATTFRKMGEDTVIILSKQLRETQILESTSRNEYPKEILSHLEASIGESMELTRKPMLSSEEHPEWKRKIIQTSQISKPGGAK